MNTGIEKKVLWDLLVIVIFLIVAVFFLDDTSRGIALLFFLLWRIGWARPDYGAMLWKKLREYEQSRK